METATIAPYALLVLVCPISMGLMMWFMAKGMGGGKEDRPDDAGEIDSLRAEQARLAAEVDRLERERSGELEPASRGE